MEPLRSKNGRWVSVKILSMGMIPIALLSVYISLSLPGFAIAFFILGSLIWSLPAAAITYTLDTHERSKRLASTGPRLEEKIQIIGERCRELQRRGDRIAGVLARVENSVSHQLNEVRDKLLKAQENVRGQLALYAVVGAEGELTMRQNLLAPLLFRFEGLNYDELEKGLKEVDFALGRIEFLRDQLATAGEFLRSPRYRLPEIGSRIQESITACRKLREAMIGRQALIALQGVEPTSIRELADGQHAQQELIETFNIQVEITPFDSIFAELELEYHRLMAEDELSHRGGLS